jgi:hypothetical protein
MLKPPAQIRTCATNASGSYLGSDAQALICYSLFVYSRVSFIRGYSNSLRCRTRDDVRERLNARDRDGL